MEVNISSETLKQAAQEGVDEFVLAVKGAIVDAAGGELNAAALGNLNAEQVTLWGYFILREEVMDGGFIQLIYNGYGSFFFRNPFARAVEGWGMDNWRLSSGRPIECMTKTGRNLRRNVLTRISWRSSNNFHSLTSLMIPSLKTKRNGLR